MRLSTSFPAHIAESASTELILALIMSIIMCAAGKNRSMCVLLFDISFVVDTSMTSQISTVKTLLTHTFRWTVQAMGFQRLWVGGGEKKISAQ